jgi:hypothetical protein
MAVKVIVNVEGAADWLAYNSNASFRLDRSTSGGATFTTSSEVVTQALTTGVERYEKFDNAGTSGSWYRFRIEDNADAELSDGWSTPFQVLDDQPIATLASVKSQIGSAGSAADDDVLGAKVDGINGRIIQRIGYYPGPSDDTSRVYHGKDAHGNRLWLPGGVRSITTLTVGGATGATQTAATSTDYITGPDSYLLRPGEPYHFLEWKDVTTGNWGYWPFGYSNVTITGLFGWGQVPDDLVSIATEWAVHDWKVRNTGGGMVASEEFGATDLSRIPMEWRRVIDSYRLTGWVG